MRVEFSSQQISIVGMRFLLLSILVIILNLSKFTNFIEIVKYKPFSSQYFQKLPSCFCQFYDFSGILAPKKQFSIATVLTRDDLTLTWFAVSRKEPITVDGILSANTVRGFASNANCLAKTFKYLFRKLSK